MEIVKEVTLFDARDLRNGRRKNFRDRISFVKYWADYVKNNPDEKWGKGQASLINSQIISSRKFYKNLEKTKEGRKILSNLKNNLLKQGLIK